MTLFAIIALLSLLNTILPDFIKNYLKVSRLWGARNSSEIRQLQSEVDSAREQEEQVRNAEHSGEYARTIKIMRAERKVAEAEAKLKSARGVENLMRMGIDTAVFYGSKVLLSLITVIVSIRNRGTPVMIIDEAISLAPFTGLLSFPTGVANAISVPAWAFSCNLTFRLIYGLVKNRRA
ncbi:guided entry of tail-anchored proteins factor 1 [Drosophila ficusphila]|uniref:guided entry of tail-anchored proteins factor 1 n=1 Tax=Drosophila ficusphila TaxID=30025 RepID=UPI001C89ED27|nr:guided entry of tail-anchored proteins factor 1 [Drosophila ficusphila]